MPKFSSLFNRNASGDAKPAAYNGQTAIKQKKKRPENVGSKLLSQAENQHLFLLLGPKRISLKASVVQLLKENDGKWQHFKVGVVTIVKDYMRKLYILMLFDIHNGNRLWEQVLNKDLDFQLRSGKQRVLAFETIDTVYGLKFPDVQEELEFKTVLDERMKVEKERKHSTRHRLSSRSSFATFQSDFTHVRSNESQKTNERTGFLRFIPFLSGKKKQAGKEEAKRGSGYGFKSTLSAIQEDKPQVKSLPDDRVNKLLELAGVNSEGLTFDDLTFVRQFIDDYQAQMLSSSQTLGAQQQTSLVSNVRQANKSDDVFKNESKFFNDSGFDRMQITKILEENEADTTIKASPIKKLPDQSNLKYQYVSSLPSFSFNQNKSFEKSELKQTVVPGSPIASKTSLANNNAKTTPKAPPLPTTPKASSFPTTLKSTPKAPPLPTFKTTPKAPPLPTLKTTPKAPPLPEFKSTPKVTSTPIKPVASDARSNLLSEIQTGIKLRSVGKTVEKSGFLVGQASEESMKTKAQQATPNKVSSNGHSTDFLSEIKAGVKLRSVEKPKKKSEESQANEKSKAAFTESKVSSSTQDSQASNRKSGDLLSEIRAGVKLRSVDKTMDKSSFSKSLDKSGIQEEFELSTPKLTVSDSIKKSNTSILDMDTMAGALARALIERRKDVCAAEQYYSTDESSDSEWDDE